MNLRRGLHSGVGRALVLGVLMALQGCSTPSLPSLGGGREEMEHYAEERYAQALLCMKASRFELARQQFAIAEKTSGSAELRRLAHEGYNKAAAIIAVKR